MRLATYKIEHKSGLGVISRDGSWVYPLASLDVGYKTMQELIETISDSEKQLLGYASGQDPCRVRGAASIGGVSLLAPTPHLWQDVICLGINHMAHTEESTRFKKEAFGEEGPYAVYFSEWANRATDLGAGVPSHRDIVTDLNCETELVVVIGRKVSHVREEEVKDYIFGYTIIDNVNTRTLQIRHKQWYFGRRLDGFLPMGPCIATVDELSYPPKVQVQSKMNGELHQDSNTELFIFDTSHIVSGLSRGMILQPGTITAIGTPARVSMGFDPSKFLVPGDVVEYTIEGIGTITSKVTD